MIEKAKQSKLFINFCKGQATISPEANLQARIRTRSKQEENVNWLKERKNTKERKKRKEGKNIKECKKRSRLELASDYTMTLTMFSTMDFEDLVIH